VRQLSSRWFVEDTAVGQGASAAVFKGFDGDNDMKIVAVKIFHGIRADNPVLQKSFQNELRAFDDLAHPNVLKFIDWGEDEDHHPFLILEWAPRDLTSYLQANPVEGWDDFAPTLSAKLL
jgi:serine/threonine protein kinase